MTSELQRVLNHLRIIQNASGEYAYKYQDEARKDLLGIERKLSVVLGELDYLVNLKIGTSNNDGLNSIQRNRD